MHLKTKRTSLNKSFHKVNLSLSEIGQLIYVLFDLSKEEIDIIENSL